MTLGILAESLCLYDYSPVRSLESLRLLFYDYSPVRSLASLGLLSLKLLSCPGTSVNGASVFEDYSPVLALVALGLK